MSPVADSQPPWSRRLLAESTAEIQDGRDFVPAAIILGVVLTLTLVILVAMCACGESDNDAKLQKVKKKSSSTNIKGSVSQDEKLDVQIRPKNGVADTNGVIVDVNGAQNNQHSRQSQASTTSSQMRPTSLRELPELPPNSSAVLPDNHPPSRSSQISMDDYDHLGREKNPPPRRENYDHIDLESPAQISEASASDPTSESHYAQVNDRTYEACNGTTVVQLRHPSEPPYNRIQDDSPSLGDEPPYSRVKDDQTPNVSHPNLYAVTTGAYTTVKDSIDPPYNTVQDDPPYNQVDMDEQTDPYNQITDPYSTPQDMGAIGGVNESHYELEPEDPYSIVDNDETEKLHVTVVEMDRSSGFSNSSGPFRVSGSVSISGDLLPLINAGFGASQEGPEDDYAVVNKDRNPSTTSAPEENETATYAVVPPEPPRAYGADEVRRGAPSTLHMTTSPRLPSTSPPHLPHSTTSSTAENKTREYSKVSARESLASMSARHALNPYEIVVDSENTYATVDGGSGDGIVTNSAPPPPSSPVGSASSSRHGNHPRQLDLQPADTYAEIGASGGALNNSASAPVPPSLDSLHLMKKHERRHLATPEDTSLEESSSHTSPNKRSSFSPTTALPGIPKSMTSSSHSNDIILETNYQTVKDSIDDAESENDPNYESVEEAKARLPKPKTNRQHHYEEVSPTSSQPTSPNNVRTRVLNRHTYEDIDQIKEEKKNMKKSQNGGKKGPKS